MTRVSGLQFCCFSVGM